MADANVTNSSGVEAPDPLASLHKMSTTAGVGTTDYVAVNGLAVASAIVGLGSLAAMLSDILFIIPVIAIVFAIVALKQIRGSNGTQTGAALAVIGLLLSLGISGYILTDTISKKTEYNKDVAGIKVSLEQFGSFIAAEKYDEAYNAFSKRFQERVPRDKFVSMIRGLNASPQFGKVKKMESNGLFNINFEPVINTKGASGPILIYFERGNDKYPERQEMRFILIEGQWKMHDIPAIFSPQQQ